MIRAGLIGGKLGHSMSPDIHEAYGRLAGQEVRYKLHEADAQGLAGLLARLRSEGYSGVNVTIPHKKAIVPLLDLVSPEAEAIGAVNTVCFEQEKTVGYNTDYFGLDALLRRSGIALRNKTVAILGSGGAARCALALSRGSGAAQTLVFSRNPGKADPAMSATGYEQLEVMDWIDVLINTTPSGMYPDIDGCR
jgi:shikimate dehydrogenase